VSAEATCFEGAIQILRELFGDTNAADFGPLKLRTVRAEMVAKGWSRRYINKQCVRVRQIFRYAASFELIPAAVVESLRSLPALQPGETAAPERPRRRAVSLEHVESAQARMRQRNRDIIDLLLQTGARPSELLSLRTGDIDQNPADDLALSRSDRPHRERARKALTPAHSKRETQR
jgi:integrase